MISMTKRQTWNSGQRSLLHRCRSILRWKLLGPFERGTRLDPFGYAHERRQERRLVAEYEAALEEILARLTPDTLATAIDLAALPERIRGFGPVKARSIAEAAERRTALLSQLREPRRQDPRKVDAPSPVAA